ncbi:glutamyl-tRNA reductase [Heyndrickxia sporothermodurans]|uniref:Glutamyl-tRNA reductase n=1 Tax=Heyndrickxia sporothermodurans TaxID=46224 RepID=A0AB37H7H0_9BACI|nr:glutamyl-tRNA reductase [Heyndrickxia sporothermodurans]MBL5766173.1 glutamyl-tRNA reductase [Heyndrickxia sporothermodurans]MBL5769614.1 glutamyl-tRNA reductase [Heyndrickxia sporothermodurans]MBL5773397.1 glutamyl-tRNA reductase [Heyndrickxia sporothermodurans]MBL5776778.1 glutamyl-tRNA reductase [Heyndrickxia sporothermodurans]MBL5780208.1 glutamyl-tRNA reductase [Heyndrickxia sporothermodurans]
MYIIAVGLNYKTAPVEIRERLSFNEADLSDAMAALKNKKSILENVIVSTCNRTEVYAVVDQLHTGRYYIKDFLSEWFQIDKEEFTSYLSIYEQDGAIEHLFKVVCGLNSMVLGETQILGQVKHSFFIGQEVGSTGTIFNQLFKQAITTAKKAHSETEIGSNAVSVSYAAVELAKKVLGNLKNKHVLVVGAGKMGKLAIENLYGSGATKVSVINRTFEKAQDLAKEFNGQAKTLQELQCAIVEADILISSTGAKDYIVTKEMMVNVEAMRKKRPLFMVDIAVPRDLDPKIAELESVFLYDIDDLEGIVEANLAERKKAAEKIMINIEMEIVQFNEWLNMLGVIPVITALREKALSIQEETMKSIERKMPNLTDRERKILSKHTKSIVNQLLKDPISQVKEIAAQPNAAEQIDLFKKIFNVETEIEQKVKLNKKTSVQLNVQPI